MWNLIKCKGENIGSFPEVSLEYQHGCTVVLGENLTDVGQHSNGSGKSTLLDLPVIALLGTSLTGRALKDYVSWDNDVNHFRVELDLHNEGDVLSIQRKVFNNTKSQELYILLNGEQPDIPTKQGGGVDVKHGNQYILDILDISKEDLLNYYFISPDYYQSYMTAPKAEKTQIINRFSNADKIDNVIAEVDDDRKTILVEVDRLMADKQAEERDLEYYKQKLEEEREFDQLKLGRIKDRKLRQEKAIDKVEEYLKDRKILCVEMDKFNPEYEALVPINIAEYAVEEDAIGVRYEVIIKEEKRFERMVSSYERQLLDIVKCPKCEHEFSFNTDINIKATENALSVAESLLNREMEKHKLIQQEGFEFDEKVRKAKQQNREGEILTRKILEYGDDIKRINQNIVMEEKIFEELEEDIKIIQASKFSSVIEKKEKTEEHIEELDKKIQKIKDNDIFTAWIDRFKSFKFYMANKPIQAICNNINYYLAQNQSNLTVHIEGFKKLKSGEIREELNPVIYRDGQNPKRYNEFSGGERARINLACDLAFQKLINDASSGGLNYYQNDELLNALDGEGIKNAAKSFDLLEKSIILVTHSGSDLNYDKKIIVIKENGKSKILENGKT